MERQIQKIWVNQENEVVVGMKTQHQFSFQIYKSCPNTLWDEATSEIEFDQE